MSMVAIFLMSCCGREIVSGRFKGQEGVTPTREKCPFGCPIKKGINGKPGRVDLHFVDYMSEELVPPELMKTWKYGHSTGDLWHKYNREWLRKKAAIDQGSELASNRKKK